MNDSNLWQEMWIHNNQHGARAKHSTVNALAKLSLYLEESMLEDKPGCGVAVDLAEAFDSIPIEITFAVCDKLGMNYRLLAALKEMYRQIQRRF